MHTKSVGLIINRVQNNQDRTSSRSSHGGRCGCVVVVVWWWCGGGVVFLAAFGIPDSVDLRFLSN
jgi:hypothetical protein